MREIIIEGVIWYAGAIVIVAIMSLVAAFAAWALGFGVSTAAKRLLMICRIETGRYWINRMENEGLIACQKEYRRMAAERKVKSLGQQSQLEADYDAAAEAQLKK